MRSRTVTNWIVEHSASGHYPVETHTVVAGPSFTPLGLSTIGRTKEWWRVKDLSAISHHCSPMTFIRDDRNIHEWSVFVGGADVQWGAYSEARLCSQLVSKARGDAPAHEESETVRSVPRRAWGFQARNEACATIKRKGSAQEGRRQTIQEELAVSSKKRMKNNPDWIKLPKNLLRSRKNETLWWFLFSKIDEEFGFAFEDFFLILVTMEGNHTDFTMLQHLQYDLGVDVNPATFRKAEVLSQHHRSTSREMTSNYAGHHSIEEGSWNTMLAVGSFSRVNGIRIPS